MLNITIIKSLFGIHNFILFLNSSRVDADFKLLGSNLFQEIGPKFLKESSPL